MSSFSEGKEPVPYDDAELYDDAQPVYRSLPASTVARAVPSHTSFDLEEAPVYRDMPLGNFSEGMGGDCAPAPDFVSASFDSMDAPTYRSIPGFPDVGPSISDGPSYRSMPMYASDPTSVANEVSFAPEADADLSHVAAHHYSQLAPPPVPSPPFRLESSHFVCHGDASITINTLASLFKLNNVDATYKPHKFKYKCIAYPGYERVEFKVRLFTRDANLLVEFQRRCGGALQYQSVYTGIRDGMVKRKLVSESTTSSTPRPFGPLPVVANWVASPANSNSSAPRSDRGDDATSIAAQQSGVDVLLSMASNDPCATVAQEATGALAMLSSTHKGVETLARPDVLARIVGLLRVNSDDIQRCAAAALANVCEKLPDEQEKVVAAQAIRSLVAVIQKQVAECSREFQNEDGASSGTGRLGSPGGPSPRLESVRHCLRALAKLSTGYWAAIEAAGGVEVIQNCADAHREDPTVQDWAAEFMGTVSSKMTVGVGSSSAPVPVA